MEFDKKIIGNRIKTLRLENKMTQETLALLLGLKGKSSIANYEAGKIIPSDKIKLKLCDVFNCPIEYLMGISDDRVEFDYNDLEKKSKENGKKYKKELNSKGKSDTRNPNKSDLDKLQIGLSTKDYTNISDEQLKQIEDFAKFVLKDNKKEK